MSKPAIQESVHPVRRKAKVRCIDQGTVYDVVGKLRKLTREIERGDYGPVRDLTIGFTTENTSSGKFQRSKTVEMRHFGVGGAQMAHWIASTMKSRVEPS
jgi:hypothetical protein